MKAIIEFIINLIKAIFGGKTPPLDDPVPVPSPSMPPPPVDVENKLDAMVKARGQRLDWRRSLVDLMKLLGLDSSVSNRQAIASRLGYGGDMKNSSAMNSWLHGQIMARLTASGGEVPKELKL